MDSDSEKNSRGVSPSFGEKKRLCHPGRPRFWHWRGSVLLAVVGLAVWGCGYTLVGSPSAGLEKGTTAVAVEPFANDTREPEIEHHATAALRRALMQGRGFVLTSAAAAPTRVQGRVRRVRTTALSYGPNDTVLEYRLEADVHVRVLRGETTLLRQDIPARAEYLVSRTGDVREQAVARDAALARLARHFAERCAAWLTIALLEA